MIDTLVDWSVVIGWIFGGCCSNVYALEAIVKAEPDSGLLITCAQFILTALLTYPHHASTSPRQFFLKQRAVPLSRWFPNIVMFFVVNMMNNYAFGYNISVPVHIILRSGGSVMTMVVGYAWGKKYTTTQVASVVLLTIGIIVAALSDAQFKGKSLTTTSTFSLDSEFIWGFSVLFVAQLLSAVMGLYVQLTYAAYGSHWHENLFYSHFLSIPLFAPFYPSLSTSFTRVLASPTIQPLAMLTPTQPLFGSRYPSQRPSRPSSSLFDGKGPAVPKLLIALLTNAVTQFACIRGVNLLASRTSAVGVSVALNVRKLVSLFISIKMFGNVLPMGVKIGAAIVFASAGLWAWEEGRSAGSTEAERKEQVGEKDDRGEAKKER